ncbi:hypothetical protein GGX14DRAFT_347217 [Mycena pura]|uniref:CxC5 like cysteine cluster associated with KDZ domain-containing protein n=1 Tax=Mycena pura TaxID=153505 RepID=A0AAD6YSD6_9AGAR|nr:hypothetical protein GGX14DRAFT_347217 [Mycena pura]
MAHISGVEILRRLETYPSLAKNLKYTQVEQFLQLVRRLWPEIVPPQCSQPIILSTHIIEFLAAVLQIDAALVHLSWHAFGDLGQSFFCEPVQSIDDTFRIHGHDHQLGKSFLLQHPKFLTYVLGPETIGPPMSLCPRPECDYHKLGEELVVEARLYTLHRGILPIFSKSLYCRSCHTRYYHNYSVEKASDPTARRIYYSEDIPTFIHVTETCLVEKNLCVYFEKQMAVCHATCQGIAQVYNMALGQSSVPNTSRLLHQLTGELVLDSFLFHAVLRDKRRRREVLNVVHKEYQAHRLDEILAERNYRMAGTGQEYWSHACDKCMIVYKGDDGQYYRMTAGVHDGVTVRHVCCSVHNCTEPVPTQRSLFCYTHQDLIKTCCIFGCIKLAQPGFRTCTLKEHRNFQTETELRNTGMFQLHSRLKKAGLNLIPDPTPEDSPEDSTALPSERAGVRGRMSRSWTHNEQLFVRCCGVILSRATFFGAEGITGVKDFLKATFPESYPGSLPSYIFYDNNCQLLKHLQSVGDSYFNTVGLPVDVFHFKCKHIIRDGFCQVNCNPAQFLELIGKNGKWVFNSSAAEQANVWFGKFQNIVQEMPDIRFNFFLDEMIAIHNITTVENLRKQGHKPHLQQEALLRGAQM